MSTKTTAQKPDAPKAEAAKPEAKADEKAGPADKQDAIEAAEKTETAAPDTSEPAAPNGLNARLTNAVEAILTSGKGEAVHALHKAEILCGELKSCLSAAIDAASEDELKADLQALLALL